MVALLALSFEGAMLAQKASPKNSAGTVMTDAQRLMAAASRKAIMQTGISGGYFDRHFTLVKVINQPGDRRIVWKFVVNEYETTITDVLGYYTENGKRIDTHSVASTLRATAEIKRTISRKTANQIMQRCLGAFTNASVEYRPSASGPARLFLTAESIPKASQRETEIEREREERERAARNQNRKDADEIEHEGGNRPPIFTGSVDLQSGKCVKGELISTP